MILIKSILTKKKRVLADPSFSALIVQQELLLDDDLSVQLLENSRVARDA